MSTATKIGRNTSRNRLTAAWSRSMNADRDVTARPLSSAPRAVSFRPRAAAREEKRRQEVDVQGENDGGCFLARELLEGLEKAQLQRGGVAANDVRGVGQLLRRLELALGVDDFGAPLALGLGLPGDRADHLLGQVDVFDLDRRDLHAPRLRLLIDDALQP